MKIITQIKDILATLDGKGLITLTTDKYSLERIKSFDLTKKYSVEIKELSNKRSNIQNNYLWALIGEINKQINVRSSDDLEVYCYLLERANVSYEYIGALEETEDALKRVFRVVKKIKAINLNGQDGFMYKCFLGSSKLDTREMAELIDTTLDFASELGINTDYWIEVLK